MHRYLVTLGLAMVGLAAVLAQPRASVLDGVYTPAQATRGEAVYESSCAMCHEGQDADGPELVGKAFLDRWREDSLEPLFTFVRTTMPGNAPGGLDERAYADVLAYVLDANGLPAGTAELTPAMMAAIDFVGPDGPRPLANLTVVRAVGCLGQDANNRWVLARAGSLRPVRGRVVTGTSPAELQASAAQPLGALTFPLMSVTADGASRAGHKVQVKGVLSRQNTVDRINVMSIDSVAPTCGS